VNYTTVKIEQGNSGVVWAVTYTDIGDRQDRDTHIPCALGVFSYPTEWGQRKGFEMLRDCMIQAHTKEIERLNTSVRMLRQLRHPDEGPKPEVARVCGNCGKHHDCVHGSGSWSCHNMERWEPKEPRLCEHCGGSLEEE